MTTSALPTLVFNAEDKEMRAAVAAGWKPSDLRWERLQEKGNVCFESGDFAGARRAWRRAMWISLFTIPKNDPRHATTLANLATLDRQSGRERRATRRFEKSLSL